MQIGSSVRYAYPTVEVYLHNIYLKVKVIFIVTPRLIKKKQQAFVGYISVHPPESILVRTTFSCNYNWTSPRKLLQPGYAGGLYKRNPCLYCIALLAMPFFNTLPKYYVSKAKVSKVALSNCFQSTSTHAHTEQ